MITPKRGSQRYFYVREGIRCTDFGTERRITEGSENNWLLLSTSTRLRPVMSDSRHVDSTEANDKLKHIGHSLSGSLLH